MRFVASLVIGLAASTATSGFGQSAAPAAGPCVGSYNVVRVSEIKPGMYQKFADAVAAQAAWYKAAGTTDKVVLLRVMDHDQPTKFSETTALTFHVIGDPNAAHVARDAAYQAFVAMYRESSAIKAEYQTCMPAMP